MGRAVNAESIVAAVWAGFTAAALAGAARSTSGPWARKISSRSHSYQRVEEASIRYGELRR